MPNESPRSGWRHVTFRSWLLAGLLVLVACGSSPSGPSSGPPPVGSLELTCPTNIHVDNVAGGSLPVTYPPPTASGGVAPVSTSCQPASGTSFPVGTTNVTCEGADAATPPRTAACSFAVTLTAVVPMLKATTFLALGDSITAGENGNPPFQDQVPCTSTVMSASRMARPQFIDIPNAYPTKLLAMLVQRYTSQTLTVVNCGVRGETTAQGLSRLPGLLAAHACGRTRSCSRV